VIKKKCLDCGEEFDAPDRGRFTPKFCVKCSEKRQREDEEKEARKEAEETAKRHRERADQARIPPLWREVTFDSSDSTINKVAFKQCLQYAENFNLRESSSLFLFSHKYGTGKTHLAACIANYVLHVKNGRVRYQKARDLLLDIRHTYSTESREDETAILNSVLGFDLLVLDDVGVDSPSEWRASTYWTVFDRRMEQRLPVVVTANFSLHEPERGESLGDRIGFGAVSRLRQMCGQNTIEFKGPDLR